MSVNLSPPGNLVDAANKSDPKQKPKPSKEVLAMVKAVKAKKAIYRKREDSRHATALIVRQATEDK